MLLSAHCTVGTEIGFQLKIPSEDSQTIDFFSLIFKVCLLSFSFLLHTSKIYIYILCVRKFDEALGADFALF